MIAIRMASALARTFNRVLALGLFALVLALPAGRAAAASFDCAKARAPVERMICADGELSRLDGAVGRLYGAARASAAGDQKQSLLQAQRAFLKSRLDTCDLPRGATAPLEQVLAARGCLVGLYQGRLAALTVTLPAIRQGPAAEACLDQAETQIDINRCAADNRAGEAAALTATLLAIRQGPAAEALFLEKLTAAQDAWEAYRDAELAARFPEPDKSSSYGSIHPFCAANAEAALSRARSAHLSQWLAGTYEGDACAGSIPIVE